MAALLGALVLAVASCNTRDDRRAAQRGAASAPSALAASASALDGPRFVVSGDPGEDLPSVVRREAAAARGRGRALVVYVGATWCEPCQRFHHAVERGELDTAFPTLTLLELDLDRDGDRLHAAGYETQFVPLFAIPRADGHASGRQLEGSIKGEGAVAEITPRLRALLASAP